MQKTWGERLHGSFIVWFWWFVTAEREWMKVVFYIKFRPGLEANIKREKPHLYHFLQN